MPNRAERRAQAKNNRRGVPQQYDQTHGRARSGMLDEYQLQEKSRRLQDGTDGPWKPTGGTIEDNSGFGVWVDNGSAEMSGGSVKGSGSYDIYIGSGAALTVNNTQVGGTVLNMGKITGNGSAKFTGTVENSGSAAAGITGCKIHRIEHRSPYKGTITDSTWDEYVYLFGYRWPKIPSGAGESISLKVLSYVLTPAEMTNTLEIPKGVTVTVDLAGKTLSAKESDFKIINHGTLTLIDSSTGGTLSIPIENDGVLNANGGTVTSEVTNRGTIQATGTPVTQFTGTLVNQEGASVTAGDFRGCTITNNGPVAGKEVVQLYISAPGKSMDKPAKELRGFVKTQLLQPGESREIIFKVKDTDLASFDESASHWVVESGKYEAQIGSSADDIRLRDSFNVKGRVTEKVHAVLLPGERIDLLPSYREGGVSTSPSTY